MYKTYTENEEKRLRATTFDIPTKLEAIEIYYCYNSIEKFDKEPKIILHFGVTNNI